MESAATPLIQMSIFLGIGLLLAFGVLVHACMTLEKRAYWLGPMLGRTGAIVATWIPVLLAGGAVVYFGSKLLFG